MMDKSILILGASSDMGLALIQRIYGDYDVIFAHYNSNCGQLAELRKTIGEKLRLLKADFSSEEETDELIAHVARETERLTHIVHLPSVKIKNINFHNSDWAFAEENINVSLRSIYKITGYFIKTMAKNRYGKILFMLTSYTVDTPKYLTGYTVAKYALLGFMKSLATEYADKSISINAVSPSMLETKFLNEIPRIAIEKNAANHPLKRNGCVDDIIPIMEFLLTDGANYITGQNIAITGGAV